MDFLIANWYLIVAGVALLILLVAIIYNFIKKPSDKQLEQVKQFLLYAVIEAERIYGSNTGRVKLSYVYSIFIQRFPWIAKVMPFEMFSSLVDTALEQMRDMLQTNKDVRHIVEAEKLVHTTPAIKIEKKEDV